MLSTLEPATMETKFSSIPMMPKHAAFSTRLDQTNWHEAVNDTEYCLKSPGALLQWAPIARY